MVTKKKVDIQAVEVNTSQTPTGKLLLGGISGQACTVRDLAGSLMDYGWYGSYDDEDGETTPVPEAVMELVTAMKDSAKNVLRMVNMFARAESAAPVPDNDSDESGESDSMESRILFESAEGLVAVEFHEASTAKVIKGQVSGTMLVAGKNASGNRFYTEEALQDAVARGLWNGKHMFLDHMTESEKRERPVRSVREVAAIIKETRYDAGTKSIKYVAQLADPIFEEKLTYMQEHGILGAIGVSIHAAAQGTKAVIDSAPMLMVEKFVEAYSTDFVTAPGAGGSVDVLESTDSDVSVEITNGRTTMDKETMAAIAELVKGIVTEAVAPIATSQAALSGRMEAVEAQTQIGALIEASELPDAFKASLVKRFGKSTSIEGVEEAITDTRAAVATLTTDKKVEETTEVKRVAKPSPVHGMGSQVTEADTKVYRGYEDFANSPAANLIGGKAKVEKLFESLR